MPGAARRAAGQRYAARVQNGLPQAELAGLIGIRGNQAAAVMSELGRHRHPHPRRAGRKVRAAMRRARAAALACGACISARIFRAAFGTGQRQDVATNIIAVEVPSHAGHTDHDADPGSWSSASWPARSSPRTRWCTAERCCTPSDRHSEPATAPGSPTAEAGEAAGARDQFAALLPIRKRASGPGDPGTLRAHARLVHWTGQAGSQPPHVQRPSGASGCLPASVMPAGPRSHPPAHSASGQSWPGRALAGCGLAGEASAGRCPGRRAGRGRAGYGRRCPAWRRPCPGGTGPCAR